MTVCQTFGWLFDAKARVVYIPSWFKWNPPENVNVMKGSLKDLNEIPPCGLVDAFARNIETLPETLHETFLEGLRQRLPQSSRTQDQYQESESGNQEQEHSAPRAVAPNERPTPDPRVMPIARDVLRDYPKRATTDELIDALQNTARLQGINIDRKTARVALAASKA